jgi:hypothetical protein
MWALQQGIYRALLTAVPQTVRSPLHGEVKTR